MSSDNWLVETCVRSYLSLVLPFSVRIEGHFVFSLGQSRNIDTFDTFEGHRSIRLFRFKEFYQHVEPEHTDTLVIQLENGRSRVCIFDMCYMSPASHNLHPGNFLVHVIAMSNHFVHFSCV